MVTIRQDDLSSPQVRGLLALHLHGMHANSPPGHVFALDLSGLQAPEVTVWTAWSDNTLAGIGALKEIGDRVGELKSMRTDPAHLRQGVGARILEHIIEVARARGLRRISLETGTGGPFEAAVALYQRRGFVEGGVFGDYVETEFNRMFHLDL